MSSTGVSIQSESEVGGGGEFIAASSKDVTVKFQIDETQTIAQTYQNTVAIADIKQDVAEKFQIEVNNLILRQYDEELFDQTQLAAVVRNDFGVVELQVDLTDEAVEADLILDTNVYFSQYALNDIVSVHIPCEMSQTGCAKDVIVEIEKKAILKPFVGGYYNKLTSEFSEKAFSKRTL